MSLHPDIAGIPGSGFTALGRVGRLEDVALLGSLTPFHFVPTVNV